MSDRLLSGRFPAPSPVTVIAVLESVIYGLVARHAYDEGLAIAGPMTLGFFLLLPMIEGCRSVASGESLVGVLSPSTVMRMLLTGAVFGGILGMIGVLVLLPFTLLMALIGGVPASLVLGFRRWRMRAKAPSTGRRLHGERMRVGPSVPGPVFPDLILEVSRCD